jgi:glutathione synthase/RimK-type ligase-like ATP-grasp enzyme
MMPQNTEVLFLTTQQPEVIKAEWPLYQNYTLPTVLQELGARVTIGSWLDASLTTKTLASHAIVCFLWCNHYDDHPARFDELLHVRLAAAQALNPALRVINDTKVISWNYDKAKYLQELENAGFKTLKTAYIEDVKAFATGEALQSRILELATEIARTSPTASVVIKPSISSSSKQTYLLHDIFSISEADTAYIGALHQTGTDGSLMIQAFEPAISLGEYSLLFIAGSFRFVIKKVPTHGEFRCQPEFGGSTDELRFEDMPPAVQQTAKDAIRHVNEHVGQLIYCRVDGVVRSTGEFIIMELECIEPDLYLETTKNLDAKTALYDVLMGR